MHFPKYPHEYLHPSVLRLLGIIKVYENTNPYRRNLKRHKKKKKNFPIRLRKKINKGVKTETKIYRGNSLKIFISNFLVILGVI